MPKRRGALPERGDCPLLRRGLSGRKIDGLSFPHHPTYRTAPTMFKKAIALLCLATAMHAQGSQSSPTAKSAKNSKSAKSVPMAATPSSDLHELFGTASGFILRAAESVPDSLYAFKPTPEVRSFGQLIGHVAGSQRMFCGAALGEKAVAEDDIEKSVTTKAGLVQAMQASNAYCERAYAMAPGATTATVELFGMKMSKMKALMMNTTHDNEHYGNIVTYMRLKGMVPPSSQPSR